MPSTVSSVRIVTAGDLGAWQEFVNSRPDAGAMHHAGWLGVLRDASHVQPLFLAAYDESRLLGIMPGYVSRSHLTGAHYTTLDGGPLVADEAVRAALLSSAVQMQNELRYVEIRGSAPEDLRPTTTVPTIHTLVATADGPEAAWSAIKTKTRWAIRQAEKEPLTIEQDDSLSLMDAFYALYAAHMHELGTPVFSREFFRAMRRHLGPTLRLYMIRHRASPIGGMLCVEHGARWTDLYAIVRRRGAPEFANYLLYWHVIRDAAEHGVAEFDLGRSTPGSNVHLFKRKWGGRDEPVPYAFYATKGMKFGMLDGNREKGAAQKLWAKMPIAFCNLAGPIIRRDLPFL